MVVDMRSWLIWSFLPLYAVLYRNYRCHCLIWGLCQYLAWYGGLACCEGGRLLDHISISPLHFEIVEQIQERMFSLKLSWTICLKLNRKGQCYFLSEKEVLASFPSSLASSGQLVIWVGEGLIMLILFTDYLCLGKSDYHHCSSLGTSYSLPSFLIWNVETGVVWALVSLLLCESPVVGLAVPVQEASQSPRRYFIFNLISPLYSLTLKIDQGAVGKKLKSIWCWGVGCRKENIIGQKGVGDKGFLFLNWAKKTFLLSAASWHSSCYFSPGFSFLLASQLY